MNQLLENIEFETIIDKLSISELVAQQRAFFQTGQTKDVHFRIAQLRKLKWLLKDNEEAIFEALAQDFRKPKMETFTSEIALVLEEIELMRDNLYQWVKPQYVSPALVNFPAQTYTIAEPYGVSLIIGAWNYPIQLTISPLVAAIAAGNCAIIKPSELTSHSSRLLANLIQANFSPHYISVVEGNAEVTQSLLAEKFDCIFFTGSEKVGKIIAQAAAKNLTPLTLELGGKSPCLVDETADIALSAKRIVWGKFFNAGQTCVAPDYLLVHKSVKKSLIKAINQTIQEFYSENPQVSSDFARIINQNHFQRLTSFLKTGKIVIGGEVDADELYIAPTVLDEVEGEDAIMQAEIFGPILPILTFENLTEAIEKVNSHPKPLALYFFSNSEKNQQLIINSISFGGGCINDTVAHFINHHLPFGGVGNSGMGAYHGKAGFDTFSHRKSIMKKSTWLDIPLRYAPYAGKFELVKSFLSWF